MKRPVPLAHARPLVLTSARIELFALLLFALVLLGTGLGLRDPWPSDEPRFVLAARSMIEHGQWLFPHRGHELYPDKPPLFMWLEALFFLLTRSWRVAFLLPSLLAGLACVAAVYDLGRRLWNHRSGLLGAAAMLFTVHFAYQFRNAQIDPLLVAFVTLANYGLLRNLLLGPAWRWMAAGCLFAGLGVITKGVGFLALLMLLPYALARRQGWRHLARPQGTARWAASLALFLLPILGWLLPMAWTALHEGDAAHLAYLRNILFGQTVERYAAPSGHLQPPWYFLGIIATDWLPLSLALPWALPAWWRRLKRRDARFLLPLGWVLWVLVFFSLSPGKRDVYILPALPMTALALAPLLPGLLRRAGPLRALFGLTLGLSLLLGALALLGRGAHPPRALARLTEGLDPHLWTLLLAMAALGLVLAGIFRVRRAAAGWALFLTGVFVLYGLVGYPMLNRERSALGVMQRARALAGPGVSLGLVAWKEQNLLMAKGPVTEFGFLRPWPQQFAAGAKWLRADPAGRRLFVQEPAMGDCVRRDRAVFVGRANRRDWWLVPAAALVSGCGPDG